MSSYARKIVGLVALLAACAPQAPTFTDEDRRAVRDQVVDRIDALRDAMNAGDAEAVMSFYAGDGRFSYLGCTEYILGGDRFVAIVSPFYRAEDTPTFHQEVVAFRVLGPDAAAVSLRGGSTQADHLFWTQVWERRGEEWVIGMEHESWPGCSEPRAPHPFTGAAPPAEPDPGEGR